MIQSLYKKLSAIGIPYPKLSVFCFKIPNHSFPHTPPRFWSHLPDLSVSLVLKYM